MTTHRSAPAAVLAACLAALAAGCGTPGASNNESATRAATPTRTDIAKLGKVTLTVWDQEVRGGQNAQIKEMNRRFSARYPNVTIKRVSKSFTDLNTTLKLAASGPSPPDVVEANNGYSIMGPLVKAHLLRSLNGYADAYGWRTRYPRGLLEMNSFSSDGSQFGGDELYGMSSQGEVVGVYYNRAKLRKLGLQVPKTFAEFEAALAKAKAAGEIPIMWGDLDKWPGIHEYEVILTQVAPKDSIRNFVFGRDGASFDTPDNRTAAQILAEWARKGYFTPGANGLGYDSATQQFDRGKGVFLVTGSWITFDLTHLRRDLGFFLLPPRTAGASPVALGGQSLPFAITSKSKHPDVAAAYIDFITSPQAMQANVENRMLPAILPRGMQLPGGAYGDVLRAWRELLAADGVVGYLDWSTPTMGDTLGAAVQQLAAGRRSPQQFVDEVESDYKKFQSSK